MPANSAHTGPTARGTPVSQALRAARPPGRSLGCLLLASSLLPAAAWGGNAATVAATAAPSEPAPPTAPERSDDARAALAGVGIRAGALVGLRSPATVAAAAASSPGQPSASGPADAGTPRARADAVPPWGTRKGYGTAALGIVGFQALLNVFDRVYFGCCDFDTSPSSIRRNLRRRWVVDRDSFTINQLGHPYQGSVYHGLARASGLNYWEAAAYTFAGSALWEIAGETTAPSRNDQVSTGIGGTFLGEALFRMSSLWLEKGPGSSFWREVGAAVISPSVGFNRLAFGQRFDGVFPSNDPEYYSRTRVGFVSATQNRPGSAAEVKRHEAIVDFALDYGLPGKDGYTYRRPFDYFHFQASASSAIGFESVLTHGLLFGTDYGRGNDYRGIWGLYGSYTYLAPQIFRMASTAISLGTTAEWRLSDAVALQASALAGLGYASVSTIGAIANERANNYGVAPQAQLALRLILHDRASLDLSAREYYVGDVTGSGRSGHDNVARLDAALTWRIHRQHAVTLRYQLSRRDFDFSGLGSRTQSRATVGIFYTLLGRDRFGTGP